MTRGNWISFLLIISFTPALFAQSGLYMPINIKKAYDNNTRSYDGEPGDNYWQNRADYNIKVELNPKNRTLDGNETIHYQLLIYIGEPLFII
jgi:hypothetical protein